MDTRLHERRAFTTRDLLVVATTAGLVALLIGPALASAVEPDEDAVCLANLRELGTAIRIFTEQNGGVLPGPLFQGVPHDITAETPNADAYLTWALRGVLAPDAGDRAATCPVMSRINPDKNFTNGRMVAHYVLNNYGVETGGNVRVTSPPAYFGTEAWDAPKRLGAIANPAREWMVADAWYRARGTGFPELQQEGPFQTAWTGDYLPNFAPHRRRVPTGFVFHSSAERVQQSSLIRAARSDGVTNAVFFDGHATAVPSRTYLAGDFELLYGFPGTVNPARRNPPPNHGVWQGIWR